MGLLESLIRLDERVLPRLARGLRRLRDLPRPRALVVVTALLVLAVVVTVAWQAGDPIDDASAGGDPFWVGPRGGDSIPGYVKASREELGRLAGGSGSVSTDPVYALVTLGSYLTPGRVADLFRAHAEVTTWIAYARVPVPRRQTELVLLAAERLPADLTAAMTLVADRKSKEAARATRLAKTESSPEQRVLYESLAKLASVEASAYRQICPCVFAVVVRATPTALAALARHPDVRVVDPAPEVARIDQAVFAAPLPEQVDVVRPPVDDDAPMPRELAPPPGG